MDELQISGKRFISSRRVAKENGYHTDYIGQLIRANKIKGQKVGRAWYVEADSFAKFLGEEVPVSPQDLAPQKSSDLLSETSSSHEVSAGQTFAPQAPASVAELAPSHPAEVVPAPAVAAAPEPMPAPAPVVVHVQPGYIPSVPFRQSQPAVVAPATSTDSRYADLSADKSAEVASPSLSKPLTSVMPPAPTSAPAHSDEYSVPLRKVAAASVGGLRYVTEEPSLPEISRKEAITRHMPKLEVEEEPVVTVHAPVAAVAAPAPRVWRKLAVVGVAAIAIFAISAVVSSGLFQNINIQEGNPASVGYTLHW